MVIPNMLHDAHDGSLEDADSWLKDNIDPVVMNPSFQSDGLLIIVFDESENSDVAHGGGHVAAILVSSKVQPGFRSTTFYQHESILRLIGESLGLRTLPAGARNAPGMGEFF